MRLPVNKRPTFFWSSNYTEKLLKVKSFYRFSFRTHFRFVVGLVTVSSSGSSNLTEVVFFFKIFSSILFLSLTASFRFRVASEVGRRILSKSFSFSRTFLRFFAFLFSREESAANRSVAGRRTSYADSKIVNRLFADCLTAPRFPPPVFAFSGRKTPSI